MGQGVGGSTAQAQLAGLKAWPAPAPIITIQERQARIALARTLMALG
jgi:Xaa-Pro dipeptidase